MCEHDYRIFVHRRWRYWVVNALNLGKWWATSKSAFAECLVCQTQTQSAVEKISNSLHLQTKAQVRLTVFRRIIVMIIIIIHSSTRNCVSFAVYLHSNRPLKTLSLWSGSTQCEYYQEAELKHFSWNKMLPEHLSDCVRTKRHPV